MASLEVMMWKRAVINILGLILGLAFQAQATSQRCVDTFNPSNKEVENYINWALKTSKTENVDNKLSQFLSDQTYQVIRKVTATLQQGTSDNAEVVVNQRAQEITKQMSVMQKQMKEYLELATDKAGFSNRIKKMMLPSAAEKRKEELKALLVLGTTELVKLKKQIQQDDALLINLDGELSSRVSELKKLNQELASLRKLYSSPVGLLNPNVKSAYETIEHEIHQSIAEALSNMKIVNAKRGSIAQSLALNKIAADGLRPFLNQAIPSFANAIKMNDLFVALHEGSQPAVAIAAPSAKSTKRENEENQLGADGLEKLRNLAQIISERRNNSAWEMAIEQIQKYESSELIQFFSKLVPEKNFFGFDKKFDSATLVKVLKLNTDRVWKVDAELFHKALIEKVILSEKSSDELVRLSLDYLQNKKLSHTLQEYLLNIYLNKENSTRNRVASFEILMQSPNLNYFARIKESLSGETNAEFLLKFDSVIEKFEKNFSKLLSDKVWSREFNELKDTFKFSNELANSTEGKAKIEEQIKYIQDALSQPYHSSLSGIEHNFDQIIKTPNAYRSSLIMKMLETYHQNEITKKTNFGGSWNELFMDKQLARLYHVLMENPPVLAITKEQLKLWLTPNSKYKPEAYRMMLLSYAAKYADPMLLGSFLNQWLSKSLDPQDLQMILFGLQASKRMSDPELYQQFESMLDKSSDYFASQLQDNRTKHYASIHQPMKNFGVLIETGIRNNWLTHKNLILEFTKSFIYEEVQAIYMDLENAHHAPMGDEMSAPLVGVIQNFLKKYPEAKAVIRLDIHDNFQKPLIKEYTQDIHDAEQSYLNGSYQKFMKAAGLKAAKLRYYERY